MGQYDCTVTPQYTNGTLTGYCVDCPEVPAIAAVPTQTLTDPNLGWNASAYSAVAHDGDCYTQFTIPSAMGVVVGLAPRRLSDHPRDVEHAFYVYADGGREYWQVLEAGVAKTTPVVRALSDVFRIERRAGAVVYFVNGKQKYASTAASLGPQVVVACLYSANDGVD